MAQATEPILIVEDSPTQALKLQLILEQNGYRVSVAKNGREAMEHLAVHTPIMVISDIVMPEMDGYEMCRRIKDDPVMRDIPVVLLTSLSDPVDVIRGLQCGADNFITKPYKEDFLISRIKSVLINREMRKSLSTEWGLKIYFNGGQYTITSDRMQIIDLLFSSFENAVQKNQELENAVRELKEVQRELAHAKEVAEKASRTKSLFLANMSHDIRTPMNGIIGMTDLCLETELTAEQREYLNMVKASADSLLSLLNDILDLSKIEGDALELEKVPFNLTDTVDETLKMLAVLAHRKGIELAGRIRRDVPVALLGDPSRLRQVVVNLVGNAVKYTERGEVALDVALKEATENEAVLHFQVRDTGVGIPKDKQKAIFDAFTQVDESIARKYGGTGLGLSISARLVGLMNGDIWVESELGEGSTFHFTARFGLQAVPKTVEQRGPVDLDGVNVLVVENNQTLRQILQETLSGWRMHPTCVPGSEAVAVLQEQESCGEAFSLVLLDAHSGDDDGFALAERIMANPRWSAPTIMMLSAVGIRGDAERCRKLGIAAYLTKPVKQSELLDAIVNVLHRRATAAVDQPVVTRHTLREGRVQKHILLAEDNLINRRLALSMLQKRGYRITTAENGLEAIAAYQKGPFDLILMDVQMPEMDGFEATGQIRRLEVERGGRIPIVAMTAHAMKGDRERCLEAGMDDYISKPIQVDKLMDIIERWT